MPRQQEFGRKRVLIVDDNATLREGLAEMVNSQPDLIVCGEAENVEDAFSEIGRSNPDVVIVDITLKESDGIELLREMKRLCPSLPAIVFTMHEESLYGESARAAGARRYVQKREGSQRLLEAIRSVLRPR